MYLVASLFNNTNPSTMKYFAVLLFSLLLPLVAAAQDHLVNTFDQVDVTLGRNKQIIPLSLPAGTKSYFYAVTILPKRGNFEGAISLFDQLNRLAADYPIAQMAHRVNLQTVPNKTANVILLDGKANAEGLRAFGYYEYMEYFLNEASHVRHITEGAMDDVYIGIENRRGAKQFQVRIEVVAVVE